MRRTSRCNGRCHEGAQELGYGLLRHGGGPECGADAAGRGGPGADVHCTRGGQLADRDGLHGMRHDHGPDGLRRGQLAQSAVRAGQGSGPDLCILVGILSADQAEIGAYPAGSPARAVQAFALQWRGAGDVRAGAALGPGGQHLAGTAHDGAGRLAEHTGDGECGLSAVRPGHP